MLPQNRKFLAAKEKEERQKRWIIGGTIAVLVIVLALVAYGVVDRYLLRPSTVVIELEGQTIKADEFEQQVRWRRRNLIVDIDQILMTYQQLGGSPEIFAYFEQQINRSVTQLGQPLLIGQEVLQALTQDLILQVEAEKLGLEVTEAEIDREIQEAFGYFADGTPTPAPTRELPESIDTAPTSTPGEEETEADDDGGTPEVTATPLLQPTEYTEELFNENYSEFLSSIKNEGIQEKTIREIIRMSLIRDQLLDLVTADVERTAEHVKIRHILVEDEDTALEVLQKLADGEDFEALAAEYSQDESNKDQGGDLGWFTAGAMVAPFEEAAFALEVGEISEPVETDFGWHILESLGKDDLLLDPSAYESLRNQAFTEWLTELEAQYEPVISDDWIKFVPTEPSLPQEYIAYIQSLSQLQPQLPPEIPTAEPTPGEEE